TKWGQRFAHECLVGERTVNFGGVEKRYATFDGRPNQRDHFFLVRSRTITEAHSHTAEPDGRDFQIAFSKFALLHYFSFRQMEPGRASRLSTCPSHDHQKKERVPVREKKPASGTA